MCEKLHRYFRRLLLNRAQDEKRGDVGAVQPGIQAGMEVREDRKHTSGRVFVAIGGEVDFRERRKNCSSMG